MRLKSTIAGATQRWIKLRGDTERGSGTVLGLAAMGVVITVMAGLLMLGAAVLARQQAQSAADLGAVAGAQELKAGLPADAACARAASFVEGNGASMDKCSVSAAVNSAVGPAITVRVSKGVAVGPSSWVARVSAHAGLVPVKE